jgi:hypothetical protein
LEEPELKALIKRTSGKYFVPKKTNDTAPNKITK